MFDDFAVVEVNETYIHLASRNSVCPSRGLNDTFAGLTLPLPPNSDSLSGLAARPES